MKVRMGAESGGCHPRLMSDTSRNLNVALSFQVQVRVVYGVRVLDIDHVEGERPAVGFDGWRIESCHTIGIGLFASIRVHSRLGIFKD
jgi:hypothetical protein